MPPKFFSTQNQFRKWLEQNHKTKTELIVGYYKVGSGKPSMTWSQSVDEALCFGWIDGVRRTIDETAYQIRFTPRKPNSIWSSVNIKKVADLKKKGLMNEAGLKAFEKRKEDRSAIYSHEKEASSFSPKFLKQLKSNKKAWTYFKSLAPGYQKLSIHWVMGAKQEATQQKRMQIIISDSEKGSNQWKNNKYNKK